ncbi:MAG: dienelactone hydrolase family protein, partial [Pseudomonadota bacterium]
MTRRWLLAIVGASAFLASCGKESETPPPAASAATEANATEASAPVVTAANEVEPLEVASQWMPYGEGKDALIRGYFAYPESMVAPLPAIIVVHDWRGLDEPTKRLADRLASRGYMVLAVDFFGGKVASSAEEAAALSRDLLEQTEAADQNVVAAYRFLTDAAGAPS